jgi:hypothetical protein
MNYKNTYTPTCPSADANSRNLSACTGSSAKKANSSKKWRRGGLPNISSRYVRAIRSVSGCWCWSQHAVSDVGGSFCVTGSAATVLEEGKALPSTRVRRKGRSATLVQLQCAMTADTSEGRLDGYSIMTSAGAYLFKCVKTLITPPTTPHHTH